MRSYHEQEYYQVTDDTGRDYGVKGMAKEQNRCDVVLSSITEQDKRDDDNRQASNQTDHISFQVFHSLAAPS